MVDYIFVGTDSGVFKLDASDGSQVTSDTSYYVNSIGRSSDGYIFVGEGDNNRIVKYDENLNEVAAFPTVSNDRTPTNVFVDTPNQVVYTTFYGGMEKFDFSGNSLWTAGTSNGGQEVSYDAVADEIIFAQDATDDAVYIYERDGTHKRDVNPTSHGTVTFMSAATDPNTGETYLGFESGDSGEQHVAQVPSGFGSSSSNWESSGLGGLNYSGYPQNVRVGRNDNGVQVEWNSNVSNSSGESELRHYEFQPDGTQNQVYSFSVSNSAMGVGTAASGNVFYIEDGSLIKKDGTGSQVWSSSDFGGEATGVSATPRWETHPDSWSTAEAITATQPSASASTLSGTTGEFASATQPSASASALTGDAVFNITVDATQPTATATPTTGDTHPTEPVTANQFTAEATTAGTVSGATLSAGQPTAQSETLAGHELEKLTASQHTVNATPLVGTQLEALTAAQTSATASSTEGMVSGAVTATQPTATAQTAADTHYTEPIEAYPFLATTNTLAAKVAATNTATFGETNTSGIGNQNDAGFLTDGTNDAGSIGGSNDAETN